MSSRYMASERQLARAREIIPLGAQTFSKSVTQLPFGVSPYFAARAQGSRFWDVDGNEYIDFGNALCAITLGHADPDVNAAVEAQLRQGTIFSLSHALEAEVAELICAMVPSAEMVRFGKNGSDATAGAVRLARAFTGRDHVLVCGYHGWQDWYVGATARHRGVPDATRALTHPFPFNDLPAVERLLAGHAGGVAAIVLEPMNVVAPEPGYLESLKQLANAAGALLVFDETITGSRFALGGAQEKFGVTPDLTTLGKGIANGFPLSAVCGRADVMRLMEEVFFSFTMGGETLSLAAAKAVLTKLRGEPVLETMRARGERILAGVGALVAQHAVQLFLSASGDPTWSFLNFGDAERASALELKTLYLQEIFARGVFCLGTHNLSYAHSDADVDRLFAVYDEVFPILGNAAKDGAARHLRCQPLEPLFKLR